MIKETEKSTKLKLVGETAGTENVGMAEISGFPQRNTYGSKYSFTTDGNHEPYCGDRVILVVCTTEMGNMGKTGN